MGKGTQIENDIVASPEIVPIHLQSVAKSWFLCNSTRLKIAQETKFGF